jgi:hypothetical protein
MSMRPHSLGETVLGLVPKHLVQHMAVRLAVTEADRVLARDFTDMEQQIDEPHGRQVIRLALLEATKSSPVADE